MKYTVWHADTMVSNFDIENPANFPDGFRKVAIVECEGLEDVFRITNHIDHSWLTNPEVLWHVPTSRSTSVGDVVEDENERLHLCDICGWREFVA